MDHHPRPGLFQVLSIFAVCLRQDPMTTASGAGTVFAAVGANAVQLFPGPAVPVTIRLRQGRLTGKRPQAHPYHLCIHAANDLRQL